MNAVCHRDYYSNGSIQVMLFKNRLEIWNPGRLPIGLTVENLKEPHNSLPFNPLLAEPMYLSGYIEKLGTGTEDIVKKCKSYGLKPPVFVQDSMFRVILWRNVPQDQVDNKLENLILSAIRANNKVSREEMAVWRGQKDGSKADKQNGNKDSLYRAGI